MLIIIYVVLIYSVIFTIKHHFEHYNPHRKVKGVDDLTKLFQRSYWSFKTNRLLISVVISFIFTYCVYCSFIVLYNVENYILNLPSGEGKHILDAINYAYSIWWNLVFAIGLWIVSAFYVGKSAAFKSNQREKNFSGVPGLDFGKEETILQEVSNFTNNDISIYPRISVIRDKELKGMSYNFSIFDCDMIFDSSDYEIINKTLKSAGETFNKNSFFLLNGVRYKTTEVSIKYLPYFREGGNAGVTIPYNIHLFVFCIDA
ncbi:MAG: hypothetical protein GXX85_13450 [Ignavibacteria bacterium]|nr:hypothetical protein [Ignavibacteria bacterium]